MQRLRSKSRLLTGYLEQCLQKISGDSFQILTPSDAERRGAMLCLQFKGKGEKVFEAITRNHLTVDYRRPDIIRVAPHPLYNSYADCFRFAQVLKEILTAR
jgi:kynureninase